MVDNISEKDLEADEGLDSALGAATPLGKGAGGAPGGLMPLLVLALLAVVYCAVVGTMISRAYIDIGDGNYLYTSSRMADGLAIYGDFLSPQPPMHLVTGSLLIRLGRMLGGDDAALYTVRVFSMILHLLTMMWIYLLGRRLTESSRGGVVAAGIYLLLPIGFWWSLGYQSELQEIFWMMGSLWFFIQFRPRTMALAGIMSALSVLTNMTAAPYALAALFYLIVRYGFFKGKCHPETATAKGRGWGLVLAFFLPFALVLGGVAGYYENATGAFLQNVIFNQVGSYPKDQFFSYAGGKILSQGQKIVNFEGGFILLGLLGLALYNRTDKRPEREFLVWYGLALLLSLLYVTKGGTMDYIFTIAEPALALFGAYFLMHFFRSSGFKNFFRESLWRDTSLFPQTAFCLLILWVVIFMPVLFMIGVYRQGQFEQSEDGLNRVALQIQSYSKPGDTIVSPPYYAFVTNRLLVEEYSELFLWTLKYQLESREVMVKAEELRDPTRLLADLQKSPHPFIRNYLMAKPPRGKNGETLTGEETVSYLLGLLNSAIHWEGSLYEDGSFAGVELPKIARDLMARKSVDTQRLLSNGSMMELLFSDYLKRLFSKPKNYSGGYSEAERKQAAESLAQSPVGADRLRLNRLLLEALFPDLILPSEAARRADEAGNLLDGEGVRKVKGIAEALARGAVPFVAASTAGGNRQLLASEEVRRALLMNYRPLVSPEKSPQYRTLNFQIQIFVPRMD